MLTPLLEDNFHVGITADVGFSVTFDDSDYVEVASTIGYQGKEDIYIFH